MELKDQVVSLELAKQLKELGMKQESLFYWSRHGTEIIPEDEFQVHYQSVITEKNGEPIEYFSAFTVAELGEMLPFEVNIPFKNGKKRTNNHTLSFRPSKNFARGTHRVAYFHITAREFLTQNADTEANARAKMLVYLIENNLITL